MRRAAGVTFLTEWGEALVRRAASVPGATAVMPHGVDEFDPRRSSIDSRGDLPCEKLPARNRGSDLCRLFDAESPPSIAVTIELLVRAPDLCARRARELAAACSAQRFADDTLRFPGCVAKQHAHRTSTGDTRAER